MEGGEWLALAAVAAAPPVAALLFKKILHTTVTSYDLSLSQVV
jgi:hypothetical protein